MKQIIFLLGVGLSTITSTVSAQYGAAPGLTYEVQIGLFTEKHDPGSFGYPADVHERKLDNGKYQYTCGEFPNYHAAGNYKFVLHSLGAEDAFVVAFIDDRQVNMAEAANYIFSHEQRMAQEIKKE